MNKLNPHIAIFLLALFTLTMVPKDWYHACEQHGNKDITTANFSYEKCSVCDFQLSFFSNVSPYELSVHVDYPTLKPVVFTGLFVRSDFYQSSGSRAPPEV
ncbi:MAG: hypothetical protein ACI8ZO_000967 [Flavobacteriales bacterium]